jgi:WD40 repeat protein
MTLLALIALQQADIDERVLGDAKAARTRLYASPDARRWALWSSEDGASWRLVVDGAAVKGVFESFEGFTFSPDSKRYAFIGRVKTGVVAVVDGEASDVYAEAGGITFSRTGKRVGYSAQDSSGRAYMVVDGNKGEAWDSVDGLQFAAQDESVIFCATRKNAGGVVKNGALMHTVEATHAVLYSVSHDGNRSAFMTMGERGDAFYIDGKRVAMGSEVLDVRLSPDGRRMYWLLATKDGQIPVLDGVAGDRFKSVSNPTFSPDSKRFVCVGEDRNGCFLVIDGKKGPETECGSGPLAFSPDGQRIAHLTRDRDGRRMAVNGKTLGDVLCNNAQPVFSPDGKDIAWWAQGNDKLWRVVVNGKPSEPFDGQPHNQLLTWQQSKSCFAALGLVSKQVVRKFVKP